MRRLNSCLRAAMALGVLTLPLWGQSPAIKPGAWAGKGIFDVLEGVMSDDAATSAAASAELARRGPTDVRGTLTSGITLAGLLPDAEAQAGVRTERLVSALARLGPKAVPQLRVIVEQGGLEGALATATLGEIGPVAAKDTAPILVAAFASPTTLVRGGAANAVVKLGPGAVPALLQGLVHSNAELRGQSARALGRLKAEPLRVVPALITALREADEEVRVQAAKALSAFGAEAQAAVPVLLDPATGEELDEGDFAEALAAIAGSSRAPLVQALNAGRPIASDRAGLALGLGHPPAIDELIAALAHPSAHVRKIACVALNAARAEAGKAAPAVARLLEDSDAKVREAAQATLAALRRH